MNVNLARWIFQSVAKHFEPIAASISLPYFVEGVDERDEAAMNSNHVELRVTGPSNKELSNDYYKSKTVINCMFTKNMDQKGTAFDIVQWTGVFADAMLDPIPVYKLGTGPDDTGQLIGCLRTLKDRDRSVQTYQFGQIRTDMRVRQAEVDAEFSFEFIGGNISRGSRLEESPSHTMNLTQDIELPFVTTWNTERFGATGNTAIKLPLVSSGSYNFKVHWGDGTSNTIKTWNDSATTHTYNSPGIYTVSILGNCVGWGFQGTGDAQKLLSVEQWGILNPKTAGAEQFKGCLYMSCNATDTPNLVGVTDMHGMFYQCGTFNGDLSRWDVSGTTNMQSMFQSSAFNNNSLRDWDVSNTTNMSYMFAQGQFEDNVDNWDTSKVTDMSYMFQSIATFNGDITGLVTANTTNTQGMFYGCNLNRDVTSFNMSGVTDARYMFYANVQFNNGGLNTLRQWDTSSLEWADSMFAECYALDQNLAGWNVESLRNAVDFAKGANMTIGNYDDTLNGWYTQNVNDRVAINFGSTNYSTFGEAARTHLVSVHQWVISDGGIFP